MRWSIVLALAVACGSDGPPRGGEACEPGETCRRPFQCIVAAGADVGRCMMECSSACADECQRVELDGDAGALRFCTELDPNEG